MARNAGSEWLAWPRADTPGAPEGVIGWCPACGASIPDSGPINDCRAKSLEACPPLAGRAWGPVPPVLALVTKPFTADIVLWREIDEAGNRIARAELPYSVMLHSDSGWDWGFEGSGASDLALNILSALVPPGFDGQPPYQSIALRGLTSRFAFAHHAEFRADVTVRVPISGGTLPHRMLAGWIAERY